MKTLKSKQSSGPRFVTNEKSPAPRFDTNGSNGEPTHDEIALCAYAIWEQEGHPQNHDSEIWLQAESQLRQARAQDAGLA